MDNNWIAGTPPWPDCPPVPGAADDVEVGPGFVILDDDASVNSFSSSAEGNRFVGHFDNAENKYVFFYAGSDQETFTGAKRTDYRLEMKMVGADVIVLETWAAVGGDDKRLQSYRIARSGG